MSIGLKALFISDKVLTDVKTVMDKNGGRDQNLWSLMGDPLLAPQRDKIITKLDDGIGALKWRPSEAHAYKAVSLSELEYGDDNDVVVDYDIVTKNAPKRGVSAKV